jgi:hypothetical protein
LTQNRSAPLPSISTNRDIRIFKIAEDEVLVIGCDSAGGIGPKPLDMIKVDAFTLGKFTARAALMEVLAVGATPFCVIDTLAVEPDPTGKQILYGIREEAEKAGLDPKLAITGSTEKNIAVRQTGIGVTVLGCCKRKQLKIGKSQPGDAVAAVGVPSVGDEVLPAEAKGTIADTTDILRLRDFAFIHELIPVGSLGIKEETQKLAESSNLKFNMTPQEMVDVEKSAGPATVILASFPLRKMETFRRISTKPVCIVAKLNAIA